MKRDQMITTIALELIEMLKYRNLFDEKWTIKELDSFSNNILTAIEARGMLPPKALIATNPDNPKFPELANIKELVNMWEE